MDGIESLFKTVGPGLGAYWAGQREGQSQQFNQIRNQKTAQELQDLIAASAFAQQENPLKLEKSRLTNEGLRLGLPGIMGDSMSKQAGGLVDMATMDNKIEESRLKLDDTKAKRLRDVGTQMLSLSPILETVPPPIRVAWLNKWVDSQGGDEKVKRLYSHLLTQEQDPTKLPQLLNKAAEAMVMQSEGYLKEKLQQTGATERNRDTLASRERIAKTAADAKITAAASKTATVEGMLAKSKNPTQTAEILEGAYYSALKDGDLELADQYRERAIAARQRAAEDAKNKQNPGYEVGGMKKTPTTADAPIAGNGVPASRGSSSPLEGAAKAAWGSYDPDKYEYRMGPNKQLQRREK